jgi:hypothetical protein
MDCPPAGGLAGGFYFNFCIWFNFKHGGPPLAFDGLIDWAITPGVLSTDHSANLHSLVYNERAVGQ